MGDGKRIASAEQTVAVARPVGRGLDPTGIRRPYGSLATVDERPDKRRHDHGRLPFVIRRDGVWLYRGSPIERRELVCLFSSVLRREPDGGFLLETPVERGLIEVEDTPWLAVELDWSGCGRDQVLSFRTNVDQIVVAGDDHPIRVVEACGGCCPKPYLHVRGDRGPLALEARIARPVYYELVALSVPGRSAGRDCLGVWSCGRFFPIGALPPDEG